MTDRISAVTLVMKMAPLWACGGGPGVEGQDDDAFGSYVGDAGWYRSSMSWFGAIEMFWDVVTHVEDIDD